MSKPFPDKDELLLTVSEFLTRIRNELPPEQRYQAQVAAFLVDVVRRELAQPGASNGIDDLVVFRDAIRTGAYDAEENKLAERLFEQTAAELQIVRPDLVVKPGKG